MMKNRETRKKGRNFSKRNPEGRKSMFLKNENFYKKIRKFWKIEIIFGQGTELPVLNG